MRRLLIPWLFCLLLSGGPQVFGDDASRSERDQQRLKRLQQLADSLQQVRIDQSQSSGDRSSSGRRYSFSSELHVRFLTAAADLGENQRDAVCLFPVQVSGFTSRVNPQGESTQTAGSDLQRATVRLVGLIGQDRPKARIELAKLDHGSDFPADQLVRDRIHDLIRLYFPEAEIEGRQRFFERELVIRNDTEQPIRAWVFVRSWDKSPDQQEGPELGRTDEEVRNEGGDVRWRWLPGDPASARPIELTVAPRKSERVLFQRRPVAANRALVWVESDTGARWLEHKEEPLWLVEANPAENGERTYHAEKIDTYTHRIQPQPGPHLQTERVLQMKNGTSEPLEVQLKYRTRSGSGFLWRSAKFTIPPGAAYQPRDDQGFRIRASRVQFVASSDNRQYTRYVDEPLWLVAEVNGRRAYKADSIGEFVYTFQPAAQTSQGTVTITADGAPIVSGKERLAVTSRNQKYNVIGTQGDWIRVEFTSQGETKQGWIQRSQVSLNLAELQPTPVRKVQMARITASQVDVKFGSLTISTVRRGETFPVVRHDGDWLSIEVTVNGASRFGWIPKSQVSLE